MKRFRCPGVLAALGLILFGCQNPSGSGSSGGPTSIDGFASQATVTSQNSTAWSTYQFNTTYQVENNTWGIGANGTGTSTIFTETIGGNPAFGWAWNVSGTGVVIYPEVGYGFSPNSGKSWGGNPAIPQVGENRTISANISIKGQRSASSTWDMAFDIWITPSNTPTTTNNSYELMIWLDHGGQYPAGSDTHNSFTDDSGNSYEIYSTGTGGMGSGNDTWTCLSYVNQGPGIYADPAFNISSIISGAVSRFDIPTTDYIASIEFGNEVLNGSGMTEISNWAITIK